MTDAVPADIMDLAIWYCKNHPDHYKVGQALRSYTEAHGPIRVPSGDTVGMFANGNEWDEVAIAEVMPSLIKEAEGSVIGPLADVQRGISILLEMEIKPPLELREGNMAYSIDRKAANGVMRTPAAALIAPHIHKLKSLQVVKGKKRAAKR